MERSLYECTNIKAIRSINDKMLFFNSLLDALVTLLKLLMPSSALRISTLRR
jgi:hypothetical protein